MPKKIDPLATSNAKASKTKQPIRSRKNLIMTLAQVKNQTAKLFAELPAELRESYKLFEHNLMLKLARLGREEMRDEAAAE